MIIDGIDYLFHYTSLENLALILKNKTIRLNSLKNMDDRQEVRTKELQHVGEFYYVSSWTEEEKESIPMWNMYTGMSAGVRIALPRNPFVRHGTKEGELNLAPYTIFARKEIQDSFLNLADLINKGVFSLQAVYGDILLKVQYTDDKAFLEPKVVILEDEKTQINTSTIGRYKNNYWAFQKEWRYMMLFLPFKFSRNVGHIRDQVHKLEQGILKDTVSAPFDYYDLDIRTDAMDTMRVTPSPRMTIGNRVILDALLSRYNPKAKVIESELQGLI